MYIQKTSPAWMAITLAMTSFDHRAQRIFTKPAEKDVMAPGGRRHQSWLSLGKQNHGRDG